MAFLNPAGPKWIPPKYTFRSPTSATWPTCCVANRALGAEWDRTRAEQRVCSCTRLSQAHVMGTCDLHCYCILHLCNINPAEYLAKQLQAVSFKGTSDGPKPPAVQGRELTVTFLSPALSSSRWGEAEAKKVRFMGILAGVGNGMGRSRPGLKRAHPDVTGWLLLCYLGSSKSPGGPVGVQLWLCRVLGMSEVSRWPRKHFATLRLCRGQGRKSHVLTA